VNLLDLIAAAGFGLMAALAGLLLAGWGALRRRLGYGAVPAGLYGAYAEAARRTLDLTPAGAPERQAGACLVEGPAVHPGPASHIHLLWPRSLPDREAITRQGLEQVCPTHVFRTRAGPLGQVEVTVHYERCIKCEACWRVSNTVDW